MNIKKNKILIIYNFNFQTILLNRKNRLFASYAKILLMVDNIILLPFYLMADQVFDIKKYANQSHIPDIRYSTPERILEPIKTNKGKSY